MKTPSFEDILERRDDSANFTSNEEEEIKEELTGLNFINTFYEHFSIKSDRFTVEN